MKKKTEKQPEKKYIPKYLKTLDDMSRFNIFTDQMMDAKGENSMLDILEYGANPNLKYLKEVKNKSEKEKVEGLKLFTTKTSILIHKIVTQNLVLSVAMASKYTDDDLEAEPQKAVNIVLEIITEHTLLKKK